MNYFFRKRYRSQFTGGKGEDESFDQNIFVEWYFAKVDPDGKFQVGDLELNRID